MGSSAASATWDLAIPRLASGTPRDALWQLSALALSRWDGAAAPLATTARIAVCSGWLRVAFHCTHERLNSDPSLPRDRPVWGLWERDVVEVFLAGDPHEAYLELQASPAGQWVALSFAARRQPAPLPWRPRVRVQATVRAHESTIELELPLADLAPLGPALAAGGPGTALRVGLFRIAGPRAARQHLAYRAGATAVPDFHRPGAWARATFAA